jgi:hypothetical protein
MVPPGRSSQCDEGERVARMWPTAPSGQGLADTATPLVPRSTLVETMVVETMGFEPTTPCLQMRPGVGGADLGIA